MKLSAYQEEIVNKLNDGYVIHSIRDEDYKSYLVNLNGDKISIRKDTVDALIVKGIVTRGMHTSARIVYVKK